MLVGNAQGAEEHVDDDINDNNHPDSGHIETNTDSVITDDRPESVADNPAVASTSTGASRTRYTFRSRTKPTERQTERTTEGTTEGTGQSLILTCGQSNDPFLEQRDQTRSPVVKKSRVQATSSDQEKARSSSGEKSGCSSGEKSERSSGGDVDSSSRCMLKTATGTVCIAVYFIQIP